VTALLDQPYIDAHKGVKSLFGAKSPLSVAKTPQVKAAIEQFLAIEGKKKGEWAEMKEELDNKKASDASREKKQLKVLENERDEAVKLERETKKREQETEAEKKKIVDSMSPFLKNLECVGKQFWECADTGNVENLKLLLRDWKGSPMMNWRNPSGGNSTPLLKACSKGHTAVVQLLLSQYVIADSVNKGDSKSKTPLYFASASGFAAIVEILLAHPLIGESLNKGDDEDWTPLHAASNKGHVAVLKLLLAEPTIRQSINKVNIDGKTPLQLVCNGGNQSKKAEASALLISEI
jgi:hypothetical protein